MKAVFMDRDGTLIVDPPDLRVDSIDEIELFPDSLTALRLLADNDFKIIVISNQAGIAEGRYSMAEFQVIDDEVERRLEASGVEIVDTFVCPHGEDNTCDCRKPKPTLILKAAKEYGLELARSYMVGDRPSDIGAGIAAGTKTILVKTGNTPVEAPDATYTANNLLEAAEYIVSHS